MTAIIQGDQIRAIQLGVKVERDDEAIATTDDKPLFTVAGGRVLLVALVGQVGTVVQTQANTALVKLNPTSGSDVDLCAGLDITATAAGTHLTITGDVTDNLVASDSVTGNPVLTSPLVLPEGDIELETSADSTGTVQWTAVYVPFDDGASMAVAE